MEVYRGDQTEELLKTWGHSSLIWMSAVLGTSQRGLELATEPDSKLSDHAVTPSTTSITVKESPELQQQLQNMVSDLAALQRLVEQLAGKQEQISRDMMTLQAAEQNRSAKISSLTQPAAVRGAPRRNIAKLVHSEAPSRLLNLYRCSPRLPKHRRPLTNRRGHLFRCQRHLRKRLRLHISIRAGGEAAEAIDCPRPHREPQLEARAISRATVVYRLRPPTHETQATLGS
jgi:hypothetical protein